MEEIRTIEIRGVIYKVSSLGKIYSKRKELKQRLNRDGYLEVTVGKTDNRTTMRVHRIILTCLSVKVALGFFSPSKLR